MAQYEVREDDALFYMQPVLNVAIHLTMTWCFAMNSPMLEQSTNDLASFPEVNE